MKVQFDRGFNKNDNCMYTIDDFKDNNDYKIKTNKQYLVCPSCKEPELTFIKNKDYTKFFKTLPKQNHLDTCDFQQKAIYSTDDIERLIKKENTFLKGEAQKVFSSLINRLEQSISNKRIKEEIKYEDRNTSKRIVKSLNGTEIDKTMPRRKIELINKSDDGLYCIVWSKISKKQIKKLSENELYENYKLDLNKIKVNIGITKKSKKYFDNIQNEIFDEVVKDDGKEYLICFPSKIKYNKYYNNFTLNISYSNDFFIEKLLLD